MSDYYRHEADTGHFLLEDGSGALLLEASIEETPATGGHHSPHGGIIDLRDHDRERLLQDDEAFLLILTAL